MRNLNRLSVAFLALLFVTCAPASAQETEEAGVREAIEHYFRGHATGQGEHFRKAFHPDAKLFFIREGKLTQWTSEEYIARASGKPAADEAQRKRRIDSIDVSGDAAVVKLTLDYPNVVFTDYMSMLKIDGQWKIVNKTFHAKPRATATDSTRGAEAVAQPAGASQTTSPNIAIIGYWPPNAPEWNDVPPGSVVVINPSSGILKENTNELVEKTILNEYRARVLKLKEKENVTILGYVPTGYFRHEGCVITPGENPKCQEWSRIETQVKKYYEEIVGPGGERLVDGIFYDETAPFDFEAAAKEAAKKGKTPPKKVAMLSFEDEFERLRLLNKGHTTAFNVGTNNPDALNATLKDEHIVLYESAPKELMADNRVDYGYVTEIGEEEAWNRPPKYWAKERKVFKAPNEPCKELLKD